MPNDVSTNRERGIIEVTLWGTLARADIADSKLKLRPILRNEGLYRILIDATRVETVPSTLCIYETISSLPRQMRVAILYDYSQAISREIAFAETVGVNRCQQVRKFSNENEARLWLTGDQLHLLRSTGR